jgi:hypothetical protein
MPNIMITISFEEDGHQPGMHTARHCMNRSRREATIILNHLYVKSYCATPETSTARRADVAATVCERASSTSMDLGRNKGLYTALQVVRRNVTQHRCNIRVGIHSTCGYMSRSLPNPGHCHPPTDRQLGPCRRPSPCRPPGKTDVYAETAKT